MRKTNKNLINELNDLYLLHCAEPNNEDYTKRLYKYSLAFARYILRRVAGHGIPNPDELIQTLVTNSLFIKAKSFGNRAKFSSWFYIVVKNGIINHLRWLSRNREKEASLESLVENGWNIPNPKTDTSPGALIDLEELYDEAEKRGMTDILEMLKLGYTQREIAAELGVSHQAVQTRLARLVKSVKRD